MAEKWYEALSDDQKAQLWDFIVMTVTEIREQIVADITVTEKLWEQKGLCKSRRTRKAFEACRLIAMGQNEIDLLPDNEGV